jgi:hypothetical protein
VNNYEKVTQKVHDPDVESSGEEDGRLPDTREMLIRQQMPHTEGNASGGKILYIDLTEE